MRALVLVSVLGFASTALAQDPSASADEARRLSRAGDAAGALRAMLRAVEQQPDDPVFHCEAGWLAFLAEESRVSDNAKLAVSPMLIPAALLDPEAVSVPEPIPLDLPVLP